MGNQTTRVPSPTQASQKTQEQAEKEKLQNDLTTLERKATENNQKLTTLNGEISKLESNVNALEKAVNELKRYNGNGVSSGEFFKYKNDLLMCFHEDYYATRWRGTVYQNTFNKHITMSNEFEKQRVKLNQIYTDMKTKLDKMKTDLQNKKTEKVRLDRTGATYSSSISVKKKQLASM